MRRSEQVYETLRQDILNWRLEPGTVLGEVEQSRRLGVSRTPVREALPRLARENLVRIIPGRGAVVTEVSITSVVQLFQMREALESYAARLAARRGDPAVFESLCVRLIEACEGFETARDPGRFSASHEKLIADFDEAIDEATENTYLVSALRDLRAHLVRLRRLARRDPARMSQAMNEHLSMCQAIRDGDETHAAQATSVHIHNSLQAILSALVEDVTGRELLATTHTHEGAIR